MAADIGGFPEFIHEEPLFLSTSSDSDMEELSPGTGVLVSTRKLRQGLLKSRGNPAIMIGELLKSFYSKEQLANMCVNGQRNNNAMAPDVKGAMLEFLENQYKDENGLPTVSIRFFTEIVNRRCATARRYVVDSYDLPTPPATGPLVVSSATAMDQESFFPGMEELSPGSGIYLPTIKINRALKKASGNPRILISEILKLLYSKHQLAKMCVKGQGLSNNHPMAVEVKEAMIDFLEKHGKNLECLPFSIIRFFTTIVNRCCGTARRDIKRDQERTFHQ